MNKAALIFDAALISGILERLNDAYKAFKTIERELIDLTGWRWTGLFKKIS